MTLYKTVATADGGCEHIAMSAEEEAETRAQWVAYAAEEPTRKANAVREERNAKLTACDWTQVSDAPVDKEAWAIYRQALRDVPDQAEFPLNVIWPVEP